MDINLEQPVREALGPRWALHQVDNSGDEPLYDGMETDARGNWLHVADVTAAVARALETMPHHPMCRSRHGEPCGCNRAADIEAALAKLREAPDE